VLHPEASETSTPRDSIIHAELGELVIGTGPHPESETEIAIAALTGVGALDAAMADIVTTRAPDQGRTQRT
jgi:ornithine cyclodeaminase/alanine dehydrogenase-like protein (mu-crystallin family)